MYLITCRHNDNSRVVRKIYDFITCKGYCVHLSIISTHIQNILYVGLSAYTHVCFSKKNENFYSIFFAYVFEHRKYKHQSFWKFFFAIRKSICRLSWNFFRAKTFSNRYFHAFNLSSFYLDTYIHTYLYRTFQDLFAIHL